MARTVVRHVRRLASRVAAARQPISQVEIVIFGAEDGTVAGAASRASLDSIERARDILGDLRGAGTGGRGAKRLVSVNISTYRSGVMGLLPADPGILWLLLLDGAVLEPSALATLVDTFDGRPNLDMAYTDARAIISDLSAGIDDHDGRADPELAGPWLLPGFSPDRLADQYYLGHMVAFRPHHGLSGLTADRLLSDVQGPWSLAAAARSVAHLPIALYSPAPSTGIWGPEQAERGFEADVSDDSLPLVSIIIPTNGSCRDLGGGPVRLVEHAVQSVLGSCYPRLEIVVVQTPGSPDDLIPRLRTMMDVQVGSGRSLTAVQDDRDFNFSNACNRGAVRSNGEVLVFLNDDTEVIATDWLMHLVRHARKPAVGPVGARLLYDDGRVQHTGIWSRGGHPTHRYEGWSGGADGYRGALRVTQNCLAVTGACLAVERAKFELVGGFSPVFPNSYNDVDLCLKLWDVGLRTVVEPRAELFHFEASSRDPSITDDDLAALHDRWRSRLNNDPFDNPNHTAERSEEFPLPSPSAVPMGGDGRPQPRFWPLEPVCRVTPS